MPTREELLDAIAEIESKESSYENCKKLVIFYNLYDRYYSNVPEKEKKVTNNFRDEDFKEAIQTCDYNHLLDVIDELMECIKILNPKLYSSVLDKLKEG